MSKTNLMVQFRSTSVFWLDVVERDICPEGVAGEILVVAAGAIKNRMTRKLTSSPRFMRRPVPSELIKRPIPVDLAENRALAAKWWGTAQTYLVPILKALTQYENSILGNMMN